VRDHRGQRAVDQERAWAQDGRERRGLDRGPALSRFIAPEFRAAEAGSKTKVVFVNLGEAKFFKIVALDSF
jgi:hypothetical protein